MPTQAATNQNTPLGFDPKYLDPANNPYLNVPNIQLPTGDENVSTDPVSSLPPFDPNLQQPQVLPVVAPQVQATESTNDPFVQGQMAPINNDQIIFNQNTTSQTLPPLQVGGEQNQTQLDPSILASSFQQFPKEDRPVLISTGANPEVSANRPLEATTEQAQEKILEELRNIEASPDAKAEQKSPETPKEEDNKLEESKDHSAKTSGAIGNISVYGYKIPQKVINLGDKLIAMKGIGDVNSAKTWLYALVGRVIEMKTTKHEKDKD